MKNPIFKYSLAAGLLLSACTLSAQIIANGDFESWGATTGTPPEGLPTSWAGNNVIQSEGLASGSTYSATFHNSTQLYQNISEASAGDDFKLGFTFAMIEPQVAATSFRTLATVSLRQRNANGTFAQLDWISFRVADYGSGNLTLSVRDGANTQWVTVTSDIDYSTYDNVTGEFTSLSSYTVEAVYDASENTYDIYFGLAGSELSLVFDNISYFYNSTTGGGLSQMYMYASGNATDAPYPFAIDDVQVELIPEPSQSIIYIGLLSILALIGFKKHKK